MKQIVVYTTDRCSFCTRVKGLLESRGLEFTEVDLSRDVAGRVQLARQTGMMTFPQVLIDDQLVGGFSETQAAAASGRLDEFAA